MYPNCMPDIMFLSQAVILFKRLLYYIRCQRDIIQPNITEFCQELIRSPAPWTQSACQIHCMDMILAKGVLQIFCSQGSIGLQLHKSKGRNSATSPTEKKKSVPLFFMLFITETSPYKSNPRLAPNKVKMGETWGWY